MGAIWSVLGSWVRVYRMDDQACGSCRGQELPTVSSGCNPDVRIRLGIDIESSSIFSGALRITACIQNPIVIQKHVDELKTIDRTCGLSLLGLKLGGRPVWCSADATTLVQPSGLWMSAQGRAPAGRPRMTVPTCRWRGDPMATGINRMERNFGA